MIVFVNNPGPRFTFTLQFISNKLFGKPVQVWTDKDKFRDYDGPRINYSDQRITPGECWIQPHSLLFENGIRQQEIRCFDFNHLRCFFKTNGDTPFDIFAAVFYLLSRYEEYLPYEKDEYGRFAHQNSLAYRENFLDRPMVDLWLQEFSRILASMFPSLIFHEGSFRFIPTYDIDEAYAYRHKQGWRTAGGLGRSILKGQFSMIKERIRSLRGEKNDPFDCYDWLDELHFANGLKPHYFFHVGLKNGKYDKQILPDRKAIRKLILQHAEKYEIGIHPSWRSHERPEVLKYEILKLTHITGRQVRNSRQHYIKFSLPQTFRLLIENGIREEFSMGYGSINGFRASVASSYYWYDLEKEEGTDLVIHPFCFMDANSFYEQKLNPEEAYSEMLRYYKMISKVNGTMITIWHNSFLGTAGLFKEWRNVYQQFIQTVARSPQSPVAQEEEQI